MSSAPSTSFTFSSSPQPYSAASPANSHYDESSQPSRKRSRTEMSPEERKEARAHRNRVAAQNSRDRKKMQFGHLEQRVKELEEENRRLRAGMAVPPVPVPAPAPIPTAAQLDRERENEELKERIKTLEAGWNAVVQALAAQGLSTGLIAPPQPTQPQIVEPATQSPPSASSFPMSPAPTPSPSFMSTSPQMPITNVPTNTVVDAARGPQPQVIEPAATTASAQVQVPVSQTVEPTRHLAAGELYDGSLGIYDSAPFGGSFDSLAAIPSLGSDDVDEIDANASMESLLQEILTPAALSTTGQEMMSFGGLGDDNNMFMGFGDFDGGLNEQVGGDNKMWTNEEETQMQMYLTFAA